MRDWDLYFITDRKLAGREDVEVVAEALAGGVKVVQYREKELSSRFMYETASKLRELTAKAKAKLIINDRVDIALAVNADGVHLGQEDLPLHIARKILGKKAIIGVTVHNVEEAIKAEKEGASYLGVSPIYYTTTKPDAGPPGGIKLLRDVRTATSLPLAAIGGIREENIEEVINAGADFVCMISATVTQPDIKACVERIRKAINDTKNKGN